MADNHTRESETSSGTGQNVDSQLHREAVSSAGDNILKMRNANVTFTMSRGSSRVLKDVDLNIERGELLGVVGESGSGKSMLASSFLDAVVEPGELTGEITYYPEDGEPINILDLTTKELKSLRWEEISMVFQGAMSSFNPTRKIRHHFKETLDAHDADQEEGIERAQQLLTDLHLDAGRVFESHPHELSGGMKQRALIALSLVLEPDVVIMDEPTAALDLLMQRSILALLDELQEKYDLTILFISHDLSLVAELSERIGIMYAFEIVEIGPTDKITEHAAHPYTRALLKSVPSLELDLEQMQPIEGSAPDPVNLPNGCSYHPRCPLADETCQTADPSLETIDSEHDVACFHWEESADAIPFDQMS